MNKEQTTTYIIDREDVIIVKRCEELLCQFFSFDFDASLEKEQIKGKNNDNNILFDFLNHLNFVKHYINDLFDNIKDMSKTDQELAEIIKEALFEQGDGNE